MLAVASAVMAAVVAATLPVQPGKSNPLHRFFDLQFATVETRYRFIQDSAGTTTTNQWQHKQTFRGALKFDAAGRYSLQATLGTGSSFTASWDATGVGTGAPTWDFGVRRLWARAEPLEGIELGAGSFDVLRGDTSEIVSYDNDAYMEGYRASIRRPKNLYLDEISVTAGYLGDVNAPNVFDRLTRLDEHNYSQVLLGKKFASAVSATFDWTSVSHLSTLREALRIDTKKLGIGVDAVRTEFYQRLDAPEGKGFAATADRALSRRVNVSVGYAHIDRNIAGLNGDRYIRGQRVYAGAAVTILPELVASAFYTHAFGNDYAIPNNQRFDALLSYNVLKALQEHHLW